ncbi:MAG: transposase [Kiritimatiellia bacterium]
MSRNTNHLCFPDKANAIQESVAFRHARGDWWVHLLVLMPDHLHMLISFPQEKAMRQIIFKWKEYIAKTLELRWQRDFFDHRLRDDENFIEKAHYVRMNPVRKGLCQEAGEWPYAWDNFRALDGGGGGSGGPALPHRTASGGSGGSALPHRTASGGSGGPALPHRTASGGSGGPALPDPPPSHPT